MAYTLQAILGKSGSFPALPPLLRITPLASGLDLVVLGTEALGHYQIPFCPLTEGSESPLPEPLAELCNLLSRRCTLAYIEAEHFGGVGEQAYALFSKGIQLGNPVVNGNAINDALRFLGVERGGALDEFDAVGLGRHRSPDEWLA